jgi:NADPH:quinone reductase-like Zn-dependent oxidoreductase
MKSYHLQRLGTLDGLVAREGAGRALAAHEVRVRMRAASLNYRDLLIILGHIPGGAIQDVIPLSDGAGQVIEVGAAVAKVSPGDKVIAVFNPAWIDGPVMPGYLDKPLGGALDGTLTEEAIFAGDGVVPMPAYLSYDEAAAFGCASMTAWASLVGGRGLRAGETLLVQGSGGVSIFALQFGKAAGARVIATTSSDTKADLLRSLGADAVVNYVREPEWQHAVRALTGGVGVDRLVEVGGPTTFQRSIASMATGGHIAAVGFSGGAEGSISPMMLIGNGLTIQGIATGSRRHLLDSLRAADQAQIRPVVAPVFEFEQAREAYEHLMARKHVGKIVIRVA